MVVFLVIATPQITAKNITDFQIVNCYLPESTVNGDTILTLSESGTDIAGAVVNADVEGNANLNTGYTITDTDTNYGKLTVKKNGDNKIIVTITSIPNTIEEIIQNDEPNTQIETIQANTTTPLPFTAHA